MTSTPEMNPTRRVRQETRIALHNALTSLYGGGRSLTVKQAKLLRDADAASIKDALTIALG